MESDAGIVERITLKNFMCHSHLGPFTFGPNVNFIVGNNGSEFSIETYGLMSPYVLCYLKCVLFACMTGGKSAVLTALIVTLGGNAMATNRGSSLKGFVKEGEG